MKNPRATSSPQPMYRLSGGHRRDKSPCWGILAAVFASGCSAPTGDSEVTTLVQSSILNGPEGPAVELTLAPLRELPDPGPVSISRVRETFHAPGSFEHTVYFYQPNSSASSFQIALRALTMGGAIEWNHTFNNVRLVRNVGTTSESTQFLSNGTASQDYTVTSSQGWYALTFNYEATIAERKLQFEMLGSGGTKLPIYWVDPPGELDMDVELTFASVGTNAAFLKGGAYQSAQEGEFAEVRHVRLNHNSMYEAGFDQGLFNFPLGVVPAGNHTVTFSLSASDSAKYWFGLNADSFDKAGSQQTWAPVQFLYQGAMHTGDYDAWNEGVAYAQGPTLVPGDVRPPPVRRGTDFVVSVEHSNLSWGDANVEVVPYSSGVALGWSASKLGDYEGGIWQGSSGHQAVRRELWQVHVPDDAPAGRYRLRVTAPGSQVMEDVLFYVVYDPYVHVENWRLSKAELETYAYDEDEDGVNLTGPYGADADSWRDNFTANYLSDPYQGSAQDTKLTGAFRRTQGEALYSMLDHAVAVVEGTDSEFEAMRRLYRFVAQALNYSQPDNRDDSSRLLLGTSNSYNPDASAAAAEQGSFLSFQQGAECFDYGTSLAAVARSVGMVARSVSGFSLGGFSNHVFTEAFIPDAHHGGGTVPYWTKNKSDVDPWYVFDATDPLTTQQLPAQQWNYSSEAIGPRSMYGLAHRVMGGMSATADAFTAGVSWDPLTATAQVGSVDDVSSAYNGGNEFWINQSMSTVTGYIGVGEKDVYSVGSAWNGASGVLLTALPGGSTNIVPKMCMVSRLADPALPSRCSNPTTQVALPAGDVYLVVFNDALVEESHLGDSRQYKLELLY